MAGLTSALEEISMGSRNWVKRGFRVNVDSEKRTALDILARQAVKMSDFASILPSLADYSARVQERVRVEAAYAPYVKIQHAQRSVFQRDEGIRIPSGLDYGQVPGLSIHELEVLQMTQPETLAQARRIEGVTPSGALRVMGYLQRAQRMQKQAAQEERVAEAAEAEAA